ncbi:MAG TPA: hypothetical protein VD998_01605 [Verrucomicrobiae bacterium]|nr:hypothetical protein [Verrucomicrobiae bacterium]
MFESNLSRTILIIVLLGILALVFQINLILQRFRTEPNDPSAVPSIDDFTYVERPFL